VSSFAASEQTTPSKLLPERLPKKGDRDRQRQRQRQREKEREIAQKLNTVIEIDRHVPRSGWCYSENNTVCAEMFHFWPIGDFLFLIIVHV